MIISQQNQQGFIMVAAVFLLVVLASLGAFMVSFSTTQHLTSAQDIQGSSAYWAARAGMEWAVGSIDLSPVCPGPVPPTPFIVDGFDLSITFTCNTYNEAGVIKTVFGITSVASSGGDVGSLTHIERSLSATAEF
jgi:MSHA biogenesis protein MshP